MSQINNEKQYSKTNAASNKHLQTKPLYCSIRLDIDQKTYMVVFHKNAGHMKLFL